MRTSREYVPENRALETVGISCSEKNSVPDIGISFTKIQGYGPAGNPGGWREKRMGMMLE